MKKVYILLAVIVVVAAGAFYYYKNNMKKDKELQYVTISINPDIELAVNSDNEVEEVLPINEDADVLLSDLELEGLDIEEASEKIIDNAIDMGYIDEYSEENVVMVETSGDDEKIRESLQEKVINKLNNHFQTREVYTVLVAKGLDDELKAQADTYDISYGKMLLVDRALLLNPELSINDLVNASIKDIQSKIKAYVKARHDDLQTTLDQAKETWKLEKASLKSEYQQKVKELEDELWEDNADEHPNVTTEQKKEIIKNLLKEKKTEIKETVDDIKAEIKDTTSNYNYPVVKNNIDKIKENIKEKIKNRNNR